MPRANTIDGPSRFCRIGAMPLAIAGLLLLAASATSAQNSADQPGKADTPPELAPGSDRAPAAPAPSQAFKPGFIDAFGHFIDESAGKLQSGLNSQLDGARNALDGIGRQTGEAAKSAVENAGKAVDAARDTAGQIVGAPNTRVADGHERCAIASNGAPDCRAAATTICHAKGFAAGKVVDTQIIKKCPASVWLSGHIPGDTECPTETFAVRAACQ
jgi:hypothetical protein